MEVFIALLIIYIIFLVVVGIPSALVCIIVVNHQRACQKLRTETLDLANGHKAISPDEFFAIRNQYRGALNKFDFMGCYVLRNVDNGKCYVGQAVHVPQRVTAHFTGRGNGDVYVDYCSGDEFEIRMIDITQTKYKRLNDLERHLIFAYDAYNVGYNKTRGNS